MKLKYIYTYSLIIIIILSINGCADEYLDFIPEDKITTANFPETEDDKNYC